jgi:hypothetical protein
LVGWVGGVCCCFCFGAMLAFAKKKKPEKNLEERHAVLFRP